MNLQIKIISRLFWLIALVVGVFGLAPSSKAQVGFQAEFHELPNVVSKYDSTDTRFSVAMSPKTFASFMRRLEYQPQALRVGTDDGYLIFETKYRNIDSLVPLAVDAKQFLSYRIKKKEREYWRDNFVKQHRAARQGNAQSGINYGIELPERFNRMFGEGGANLRVNGYRRITFSGRSQWSDGKLEARKQSKFPSLNMEQNYRLDITGTIGSKISVKVSEDSRSEVPLSNRIQLRYKGDDDDILKTVEAGNTNLSLPRSRFVGYSSRIQGLFGLKAEAQVGHLNLTAIASQEKGSAEQARISAGGEEGAEYIRDYDYVQGQIFDLGPDTAFAPGDSVMYLEVWEFERNDRVEDTRFCQLYVDPNHPEYASDLVEVPRMVKIDPGVFTVYNDHAKPAPYVVFNSPRFTGLSLGMYMEIKRENGGVDTVGSKANDTLVLKTLRHGSIYDHPSTIAWGYMWRNAYKVPTGVSIEDLKLVIKKGKLDNEDNANNRTYQTLNDVDEGEYIEILGLDQYNTQGASTPDNLVDGHWDVFRQDLGLIIFPNRTPFNTDTTYQGVSGQLPRLRDTVPTIYDYTSLEEKTRGSAYYLQYSVSTRSSTIHLNRANIIEGSERVTLNGAELTKDVDYTINYDFGQVTVLRDEALDPNAELNIDFEYAPFLAIQKKTLLGVRAEYEWSRDLKFGSTILYKSDKAQERKPRVGQETAKMMVMDFDFSFRIKPSFLTKAADALPFYSTEVVSNLNIEGEIAQSRPNPNIDDVAYIDDFEASHEQLSLGVIRSNWYKSSRPGHIDQSLQRGKLLWHNTLYGISAADVYDREFAKGEGVITPFRVIFRPDSKEHDPVTGEVTNENARKPSWAGMVRSFGSRVDEQRVQVLELRVRGDHGRMHLDFGRINEDVDGNGSLNKEETGYTDFVVDSNDIGLDLLPDAEEPGYDPETNPDPDGDNWFFLGDGRLPVPETERTDLVTKQEAARDGDTRYDSLYYEWLNGTEGNVYDISTGGRGDSEALTREAFIQSDAYFSYVIDMSPESDNDISSFFVQDSRNNRGWKTYRIPIRDSLLMDTTYISGDAKPDWSQISHIRVWFDNDGMTEEPDTVEIAAWYFVQSNWRDTLAVYPIGHSNSAFVVATVSEDEGTFQAPPGVSAYTDVANDVTETQRGLALIYKDLRAKDTCIARKELLSIERYSGYGNLEVYVHGDEGNLGDSVQFFFRVGEDENNFYEYHSPEILHPGWDQRNFVNMSFDSLTILKDSAQRNIEQGKVYADIDVTSGRYRVKGDPNINEVSYFAAGILNLDTAQTITGEVWLDELRVTNVRKDVGTAARVSASGNLADLFSYSFNYDTQDAYFRGISTATRGGGDNNLGSGSTSQTYGYGLTFNLDRFVPKATGLKMPVSYSFSRTEQLPLLRVRSDIVLPEEQRQKEKTVSETQSIRVSESFRHKGKNILYDALLNRQKFAFSYSKGNSTSPNRPQGLSENYNVSGDFDAGWRDAPRLPLFFFLKSIPILKKASETTLGLFPSSWSFSGKFNRTLSVNDDINGVRSSSLRRDMTGNMRLKYDLFQNLSISFSYDTKRDLSDPDLVAFSFNPAKLKLGIETSYRQSFATNYDPRLISWLSTKWGYTASYSENYDQINRTRKSDMSSSWSVSGTWNHQQMLGGRGGGGQQSDRGQRVRTTRRNVRGGQDPSAKSTGGKFYDKPLAGLRFLTGWLDPFSYKYAEGYARSTPGMQNRPGWSYRLGFVRDPNVAIGTDRRPPSASENVNYETGSGFNILGGIVTDVKFKRSVTTDLINQGSLTERTTTSWPSLTIRINRFKTFPLIKNYINKFIDVFSPRTSYSRDLKEDFNLTEGYQANRTETKSYSPLLSLTFKVFRSFSVTGSYTITETNRIINDRGNLTETRGDRKSLAVTSQYSFSAPGGLKIPIFGKLRFKSEVTMSVKVSKNTSFSEKRSSSSDLWSTLDDKSDLTIAPNIAYTFSRQVKGGISGRWQDTEDNQTNRRNHVRELQIWAEIRF